jgi:hypothetical protein
LQRFKCRACQRTFNALSKTPLARLRNKAKCLQQKALGRGLIVRLASAELGVAPSTAFRWRHRFLQLTQPVKALVLTGVVEADETSFCAPVWASARAVLLASVEAMRRARAAART